MPYREIGIDNSQVLQAVAFALDVPVEELAGFVIVGIHPDNSMEYSGNQAHLEGLAAILAAALADIMYAVASSIPLEDAP